MKQAFDTSPVEAKGDSRERILDAAERLFAEHGFEATSLRQITTEAQVNVAAVNYYFGAKEPMIEAVLRRRLGPINQRRLEMLDELEASKTHPPLEAVLHALFWPAFEARASGVNMTNFARIMGRLFTDPSSRLQRMNIPGMDQMLERFGGAIGRAQGGVAPAGLTWGMFFGIGTMAHALAGQSMLQILNTGVTVSQDPREVESRLVKFVAAGIRAVTKEGKTEKKA